MKLENEISYKIRGISFNVYNTLGPGLFESVYEEIIAFELKKNGIQFQASKMLARLIWKQ